MTDGCVPAARAPGSDSDASSAKIAATESGLSVAGPPLAGGGRRTPIGGARMDEPTIQLLERVRSGDAAARGELMARVYAELRALAGHYLAGERREHTLQPTALVHEAFVRLSNGASFPAESRAQFFALAARSMRQVLIDHARARRRAKRDAERTELDEALVAFEDRALDLLALDEALGELERAEPRLARLIELRFFAGLESDEIARVEGLSERTVRRDLLFARGWLRRRLEGGAD